MSERLTKKADKLAMIDASLIQIAFNEILGTIYWSGLSEEKYDELIETMANLLMAKLDIDKDKIDWQMIEEWHYKESYKLLEFEIYLNFKDATKIISKSKVSDDYNWEDISSSVIPLEEINKKMINEFKEYLELNEPDYLKKYTV